MKDDQEKVEAAEANPRQFLEDCGLKVADDVNVRFEAGARACGCYTMGINAMTVGWPG